LTVPTAGISIGRSLAVTLYFADSGQVTLELPVGQA
jgi:hypothetical protein